MALVKVVGLTWFRYYRDNVDTVLEAHRGDIVEIADELVERGVSKGWIELVTTEAVELAGDLAEAAVDAAADTVEDLLDGTLDGTPEDSAEVTEAVKSIDAMTVAELEAYAADLGVELPKGTKAEKAAMLAAALDATTPAE